MRENPDRQHLLSKSKDGTYPIKVGNKTITNSKCKKLLDIKIDEELNLNDHAQSLCKKDIQEKKALSRVMSVMNFEQR